MLITGVVKSSLIDYPKKVAAVAFLTGCNFRCHYCHNPEIVFGKGEIKEEDFLTFLKKRAGKLDGVVISGGEPTLHKDLPEFAAKIKNLGFEIKLDTNGTNPKMVKRLINSHLLDYIAMDIKGPLEKYFEITNSNADLEKITETMEILAAGGVEFEYRTTVVKGMLVYEDFFKIRSLFEKYGPPKNYYLQKFQPQKTLDKKFMEYKPLEDDKMDGIGKIFDEICSCYIR